MPSLLLPEDLKAEAMDWGDVADGGYLGDMNWNDQHIYSLPDEGGDVDSVGSAFIDEIMHNGSSENITDMSYSSEEEPTEKVEYISESVQSAGKVVDRIVKRTIDDGAETDDRPSQYDHSDHAESFDDFHGDATSIAQILIDFSKSNRNETKRAIYLSQLKSDIAKYLADKLAKNLNLSSINVPWSQMKKDDLINWPSDVKFDKIYIMNLKDVQRVHELVKKDLLDFSPEFLSRFKIGSRYKNELKSNVTKYLTDKLAKALNMSRIYIPWLKMKEGDIINWPQGVDYAPIYMMNTNELKKLNELAKKGLLEFAPDFLSRFKDLMLDKDDLRPIVTAYLADKLAKKLNVSSVKIPWSNIKEGDIINWPQDVKFIPVYQMSINEVRKLHQLAKKDLLDFTPKFVSQFQIINDSVQELRTYLTKYMLQKLAKKTNNSNRKKIPWSKMKEGDIINWPQGVDLAPFYMLTQVELEKLRKLAAKDLLDFSPDLLKLVESKSARSEFHDMIRDIETELCNKLNAGTNKQFKQIPWTVLKKEDIINWPEGIPLGRLTRQRMKHLESLHKLREVIFFSKDFLKRLSDPKVSISRYIVSGKP